MASKPYAVAESAVAEAVDGKTVATLKSIGLDDLLAHSTWIRGLARSLVRDPSLADDVAQDALLRAWRRRSTLRESGSRKQWLAAIGVIGATVRPEVTPDEAHRVVQQGVHNG